MNDKKIPISTQVKAKAAMEKAGVKEKASTEIKKLKDNLKQQIKRTGTYLPKLKKETRKKVFKIKNEFKRNNININKTMKKDLKLLMEYGTDAQRAKSFMRKTSETGKKPKAIRTVTTDKKGKIISKSKPVSSQFNMGVTREMPYDRPSKPANSKKVASKKPTGKKITPAQQKVINQAAPLIEKIDKGYQKGSPVKFAPEPEKPIIPKRGGGMTRQGLYPAEESRSGTMPEDERKRYMTMGRKGGGIVYRNMGRAIGGDMGGVSTVSYFYDD